MTKQDPYPNSHATENYDVMSDFLPHHSSHHDLELQVEKDWGQAAECDSSSSWLPAFVDFNKASVCEPGSFFRTHTNVHNLSIHLFASVFLHKGEEDQHLQV